MKISVNRAVHLPRHQSPVTLSDFFSVVWGAVDHIDEADKFIEVITIGFSSSEDSAGGILVGLVVSGEGLGRYQTGFVYYPYACKTSERVWDFRTRLIGELRNLLEGSRADLDRRKASIRAFEKAIEQTV